MDHPNIGRVLVGGLTPEGRPFYVRELVNGLALTRFCDEARRTPKQRLGLLVPVCQAGQLPGLGGGMTKQDSVCSGAVGSLVYAARLPAPEGQDRLIREAVRPFSSRPARGRRVRGSPRARGPRGRSNGPVRAVGWHRGESWWPMVARRCRPAAGPA